MLLQAHPSRATAFAVLGKATNMQVRQPTAGNHHPVSPATHRQSPEKPPFKGKSSIGIAVAVLGAAAVPMAFILIGLVHLV